MNERPNHVCQSQTFHILCGGGQIGVEGNLGYSQEDPYAVTATFRAGTDDGVQWLFARDLLIEGLISRTGDGDFRIGPDDSDADSVIIELQGPDRCAVLAVPAVAIAEFLTATYAVVAVGDESRAVDIDGELALLANDWF